MASFGALGCSPDADSSATEEVAPARVASHRSEVEAWRADRDRSLRKADGWLSLAGLHWLGEGRNTFGSGAGNDLEFPAGKIDDLAGTLVRSDRSVRLEPAPEAVLTSSGERITAPVEMTLDSSDGGPLVVESGDLSFYAIERGEMIGIRLKDRANPVLKGFSGMNYFPIQHGWRVVGEYELFDEPRILRTPNVLGTATEEEIEGQVTFEFGGERYSLQPTGDPADGFFLVFGDETNGVETYGGGRFLYSEPVAEDGTVVVDFNKAYCPPCVFTPYATCPLPPPENRLAIRVEAGEKMFGAAH